MPRITLHLVGAILGAGRKKKKKKIPYNGITRRRWWWWCVRRVKWVIWWWNCVSCMCVCNAIRRGLEEKSFVECRLSTREIYNMFSFLRERERERDPLMAFTVLETQQFGTRVCVYVYSKGATKNARPPIGKEAPQQPLKKMKRRRRRRRRRRRWRRKGGGKTTMISVTLLCDIPFSLSLFFPLQRRRRRDDYLF